MPDGEKIEILRAALDGTRRVAVFTGAGMSTESGIPDFRSPGGWWTKNRPIDFADFLALAEMRREAWRQRFALGPALAAPRPPRAPRALSAMFPRADLETVITPKI